MKKSRNTFEPSVICEALEPRLLLSVVSVEPLAFLDFTEAPAYISANLLPGDVVQDNDIVSSDLRQSQQAIASMLAENPTADLSQLSSWNVRVNQNGDLHVYVHVDQVNESIVQNLLAAGLSVENANEGMGVVQGWVNHTLLDSLASMESVRRITAPAYGVTNTGSITTAGDGILNADDLRSEMSVTGSGVKIGVISDGLDHWDDVDNSGDLPTYSTGITVHSTFSGYGDEGTAMLEIIYDLAPDADLYFAGRRSNDTFSSADMISAIDWMVAQGVDVIVDDVTFFDQPMFEDGTNTVADAAADAVTNGVVYVSAAGNYADEQHYQADYYDYGDGTHEFATNQNILRFYLEPNGGSVTGAMQWSDQWGSSGNNYDLYLYEWTGSSWDYLSSSTTVQNGDDNPLEWISATNNGQSQALLSWLIDQESGSDRELEFFMYGDPAEFSIYSSDTGIMTPGDSIFGHRAVESVITVGAIDASDPGNDDVEAFSSRGPSTVYTNFSTQTSTTRNTLDVAGIDGVSTKVGDLGYFSDPFYGTSAAAPHIAAIAGLLLEIDPTLTPAQVQDLINDNAVDILTSGYDDTSGYGRADALATVTTAATAADLLAASDTGASSSDDLTKLDNSAAGKELQFDVSGTIQDATVRLYGPGDVLIGQGTGNGGTLTITTNGSQDLTDGVNGIYATQEVTNKLESAPTTALSVTIDTVAPSVGVTSLETTDRTPALTGTLNDSQADIEVTVNGQPYTAVNNGNGTWTLADDTISPALIAGTYDVAVRATDVAGNEGYDGTTNELTIYSSIADRLLFYNNSIFDTAEGADDDDAIAPDKEALLPGETSDFANQSGSAEGINGIMVDIYGLAGTLTADDFIFRVSEDGDPSDDEYPDPPDWSYALAPDSITVRSGEGVGGSDRIVIIWDDNDIQKQWLQITVLSTGDTGLEEDDVFYFGHILGDANGDGVVSGGDYTSVQINFGNSRDSDDEPYDLPGDANGDWVVSSGDYGSIQANFGDVLVLDLS